MKNKKLKIRFAGFGGQGVVLSGLLLGKIAVKSDFFVSGSSSYGAQARGSICKSDIIISHEQIDYPYFNKADILIAMNQHSYENFYTSVENDGLILLDSNILNTKHNYLNIKKFSVVDSIIKNGLSKQSINIVWLGITLKKLGISNTTKLLNIIYKTTPERFKETNKEALILGYELNSADIKDNIKYNTINNNLDIKRIPIVKQELCNNCNICICELICPEQAISRNDLKNVVIDIQYCKGCRLCESFCYKHSIHMK